ncbi:(2Fe-2S) ferredoxin domain-containing protein [Rhodoferax sp. GW822-FHT02A01]|uniref:(2Fe-2S) ferredoxin domain-containing protein n=1 Tax=Rhodoferax sp. GW822-FHT02A01 TaxID=3141537 RepID=UPI00315DD2CF
MQAFWKELQTRNAFEKVGITYSGCLGPCEGGVNVVVFPDSVLYSRVTVDDVPEIFQKHLLDGEVVARLAASAGTW